MSSDPSRWRATNALSLPVRNLRILAAASLVSAFATFLSLAQGPHDNSKPTMVTFNKDVAPILFKKCAPCHHSTGTQTGSPMNMHAMPGHMMHHETATSFSLLSYRDAKMMAGRIKAVTENRTMPLWKPVAGYNEFLGARHLTNAEIRTFQQWIDVGMPEGRPEDLPPAPHFAGAWDLGHPDLILKTPKPYTLPVGGSEFSRCFVVPARLPMDAYIEALEIHPTDPSVVHHAILVEDRYGAGRRLEKSLGGGYPCSGGFGFSAPGYFAFWTMGFEPRREPPKVARVLKKGADLVIQVHFHPAGTPVQEQIEIGLHLAGMPPQRIPMNVTVSNYDIDIAPGDKNYKLKGFSYLPADVEVLSIFAHAHRLAREVRASAELPDGTVKPLLWIRNWDPHWQEEYWYAHPLMLPQGTRVSMEIQYDNSADNPRNADHLPKRIVWGQHSTDEMGEIHLQVISLVRESTPSGTDTKVRPNEGVASDEASLRLANALPEGEKPLGGRSANSIVAQNHNRRGLELQQGGDLSGAIAEYRQAVELDPGWAAPYNNLGLAYKNLGELKEAIREFEVAVQLGPEDRSARANLGLAFMGNAQWKEAIASYQALIQLDPAAPDAYYNLALCFQEEGEITNALSALQKCIALKPEFAEAHLALAKIFYEQGKIASATAESRAAIATRADYAEAYYLLATMLNQQGERGQSRAMLKTVLRIDPGNSGAHLALGMLLKEDGDLEGAAAELREGETLREAQITFQAAALASNAASQLLRQGDLDGSIQKLRFALSLIPNFAWVHYQLGIALWEKHEYTQASAEFETASRLDERLKPPVPLETPRAHNSNPD